MRVLLGRGNGGVGDPAPPDQGEHDQSVGAAGHRIQKVHDLSGRDGPSQGQTGGHNRDIGGLRLSAEEALSDADRPPLPYRDRMLFKQELWAGLADGTITCTFRRWRRAQAKPGGRYRTPAGVLQVETVAVVDPAAITDADAARAGFPGRAELVRALDRSGDGPVYRVEFHLAGPDPREALRQADRLSDQEWAALAGRLDRLDRASRHGPWTEATLRLIAERPGVRAAELAAAVGRDRHPFKLDVRKLKELGLTESLEVGYRLSPRGRALCLFKQRFPYWTALLDPRQTQER